MSQILTERLRRLEATHRGRPARGNERMPVFYGWAKLNKVMKREALMVIFLNDNPGPRINKDGKYVAPGIDEPCPTVAVQNRLGIAKVQFLSKQFSGEPESKNVSGLTVRANKRH